MTIRTWTVALLGATALTAIQSAAYAQSTTTNPPASPTEVAPSPAASDTSTMDRASPAATEAAPSAEESASQIEFLQAQVEAMQAQLDALKKQTAQNAPNWKGAPELSGENGWKFKVRGRLQYDVGYTENPDDRIPVSTLGFNSRVRRARLGVEGSMPGDFLYKVEFDFANSAVGYGDVILSYAPAGKFYSFTIGNHETFQGLEQPTSSRFISFLERAQMFEAFDHTRRLGASIGLVNSAGDLRLNMGVFNDRIRADNATSGTGEGSYGNDDWLFAARAVWSPQMFGGLIHLGANYQHREFQKNNLSLNYQVRPFTQTTDQRFVSTGAIAAEGDDIFGVEFAGIFKSLHVTGEAQLNKVRALSPTDLLTNGRATTGTRFAGDPEFFAAYAEIGYWLTGETRGYKNGLWDRTKVLNPFDKGGWGAFQINARYDYLDLTDRVANGTFAAPNFVNGGKQTGYLLSLVWQPIDYVRLIAQYTRSEVEGGPRAAIVKPTSTDPVFERDFGVNVFAMRAQFDF